MLKQLVIVVASTFAISFSAFGQASQPEIVKVVWEGKTFKKGDRVKVVKWAGTAKPEVTGHRTEVSVGPGRTGTIVAGKKRVATSYFTPEPDEPIQIVLVRWDAQAWPDADGKPVNLRAYGSTIHVTYLEVVTTTKPAIAKPKPSKRRSKRS